MMYLSCNFFLQILGITTDGAAELANTLKQGPIPLFKSLTTLLGRLEVQHGASPSDYFDRIDAKERSTVSYIHDFRGCEVNVEIFDRTRFGREFPGWRIVEKHSPIVVEVLRKVMEIRRNARGSTLLADYIRSAMSQNRAGQMRGDLFAAFRRSEVNLAAERDVGQSDVALKSNSSRHNWHMLMEDPMAERVWGHLKEDVQLIRNSILEFSGESIINPMTKSDGMDKNRAGKREEDLFGPKDNLAVGVVLSDVTFTGHGGGGLALQRGAGMYQSTNPYTNPELYHSPEAIQRGDGGNSQGLSDTTFTRHGGGGLALQRGAGMHQSTNPLTNPELYHSPEAIQRDGGSGLANSQDGTPLQGQVLEGAVVHKTHPMKWFASLVASPDDLESQGADIPVLERIYHLLSEHDQTFQHWLRDAGTVGASFSAVYARPSLTTQLPAAVAFVTILTAMWLSRKRTRTKSVLTKFGALACIASVMSAMVKYLSPVGMAIAGPLLLIPAGVVVLA